VAVALPTRAAIHPRSLSACGGIVRACACAGACGYVDEVQFEAADTAGMASYRSVVFKFAANFKLFVEFKIRQGLCYALGQLQALSHLEIGGNDIEWNGSGNRKENGGCSLVEAIASTSIKSLALTQSHAVDSDVLSQSAHIQNSLRLLQVLLFLSTYLRYFSHHAQHLTHLDFSGCGSVSDEVTTSQFAFTRHTSSACKAHAAA
jgi:hypothetical protein